jgi:hypothetical protein
MRLLLFLSAILAALSGVGGACTGDAARISASARAEQGTPVRVAAVARVGDPTPVRGWSRIAPPPRLAAQVVGPDRPLYAERRRE